MQTQAATDPETLDTTLLIHPAVMGDFLDFHFLLAAADAAIRRLAEPYRSAARDAIVRVADKPDLSNDVREVVTRALAE